MILDKENIVKLLQSQDEDFYLLLKKAREEKIKTVGNMVYFRGLVEFSNNCAKDCYYCGIRKNNEKVIRYDVPEDEILDACRFAHDRGFGSMVLQSGELSSPAFIKRVDELLKKINKLSNGDLGITLSCGEQSREIYRRWYESGAHRYLLRIEATNRELYYKIHPKTENHSFEKRLEALQFLRETGYQLGTGVMIGLPFQSLEDLADDLLFFKKLDIDMCGMGPYVEHENTPLYNQRHLLQSPKERFKLALKMIAVLRLIMPDINIASATALEAIDPDGRRKALDAGANVVMPNLTPPDYRKEYRLYKNKPGLLEATDASLKKLKNNIESAGYQIGWNERGDSKHFTRRTQ